MEYLETNSGTPIDPRVPPFGSWWLHEPPPNQSVAISSSSAPKDYLINQTNPSVRSFFQSYVRRHYNSDDGLLMDGQTAALSEELYYASCGCRRTDEIATDRALQLAHQRMSAAMTHRNGMPFLQADNTLAPNPFLAQGINLLNASIGVAGVVIEGYPESYGALDPDYSTLLDQIADVASRTRGFVLVLSYGAAGASYQAQSRRVQEATMLLGYSPGHLVDWAALEQGSRDLAVWPEEGIYPTEPLQTMRAPRGRGCLGGHGGRCSRGGHNDIAVARGVYRREFNQCYDDNVMFGPCAAIVNTSSQPVIVRQSWLHRSFGHEITLLGGDVQSGGRLALRRAPFTAGATVAPPDDALLLSQ